MIGGRRIKAQILVGKQGPWLPASVIGELALRHFGNVMHSFSLRPSR
jgi:hypothetical protein